MEVGGPFFATKALQDARKRQHSAPIGPERRESPTHQDAGRVKTLKSCASERRESKERWLQATRREVGRVSHKVRPHVLEGENANQQKQGEWTRGGEERNVNAPTGTMEQHPAPAAPKTKPNAEEHAQHADPKGRHEQQEGGTPSMKTGQPP